MLAGSDAPVDGSVDGKPDTTGEMLGSRLALARGDALADGPGVITTAGAGALHATTGTAMRAATSATARND